MALLGKNPWLCSYGTRTTVPSVCSFLHTLHRYRASLPLLIIWLATRLPEPSFASWKLCWHVHFTIAVGIISPCGIDFARAWDGHAALTGHGAGPSANQVLDPKTDPTAVLPFLHLNFLNHHISLRNRLTGAIRQTSSWAYSDIKSLLMF